MTIIASFCWKCESPTIHKYGQCLRCNPEPEPKAVDRELEEQGQAAIWDTTPDEAA